MIEFRFRVPEEMAPVAWHHVSDLAGVRGLCAVALDEQGPTGHGSVDTRVFGGDWSPEDAA